MQKHRFQAGFTLIELLVVIAILGLLIATFLPDIFSSRTQARKAADAANLRWHYGQFTAYDTKHKGLTTKTGHKFIFAPWVAGDVQRTPENFARYWLPEMPDPRKEELAALDPETIWRSFDDLRSDDTHYAGPGPALVRQRLLGNGKLPMMSDDNELVPSWEDFSIIVLLGSGQTRELTLLDLEEYGFDPDQEGAPPFEVGPASPHPLLQQLER